LSAKGPSPLSEMTDINSILISNSSQTPKSPSYFGYYYELPLFYCVIELLKLEYLIRAKNVGIAVRLLAEE